MEMSIDNLNESIPEHIRKETMERIIGDRNFNLANLMFPLRKKDCWHFCALTIKEINNERLYIHTFKMIEWLQDINWPGALIVLKKLATFPPDILEPNIKKAKFAAELAEDSLWLYGMEMLDEAIAKNNHES